MTNSKKLVALAAPMLVVVGVWALRGNAQNARENPGPRIESPDVWVPFTAELRQVKPRPNQEPLVVVGRFYRSSNGSERTESGYESEPPRVIDIKNIARGLYYTTAREKDTGRMYWVEQPLGIAASGWRPITMTERSDRRILKEPVDGVRWWRWSPAPAAWS